MIKPRYRGWISRDLARGGSGSPCQIQQPNALQRVPAVIATSAARGIVRRQRSELRRQKMRVGRDIGNLEPSPVEPVCMLNTTYRRAGRPPSSEESSVGQEVVSTCRTWV